MGNEENKKPFWDNTQKRRNLLWTTFCITVIAIIFIFGALKFLDTVLKPVAFAWILMAMLAPLVNTLTKKLKIPELLSIVLSLVFTIFIFFISGVIINSLLTSFISKYAVYVDKLELLIKGINDALPAEISDMISKFEWKTGLSKKVISLSGSIISASTTTVIVLIITAFMLIEKRDFSIKVSHAFNSPKRVSGVFTSITSRISKYLVLHTLISLATGISVWLVLSLIKIEFAATWGFITFVLNYIPTIGSIIASIPPILIALVQYAPETFWPAILTALALLTIQMIFGNIIEPRLMGDHLNLSPVAVLISLLFWGWLWGPAGALLATPITAAIKIICDNIEPLRPIGVLLGSARPFRKA